MQLIEAGAAHVIATEEVDLVEEVMRITDGKGARVVFDPVGGPNFPKLISALAFQGTDLPVFPTGRAWERTLWPRVRDRDHSPVLSVDAM